MKASAVIVAGGKGLRMKKKTRKQYLFLAGQPVLAITLKAFNQCQEINEIILVVPEDDLDFCRDHILSPLGLNKKIKLIPGGLERQNSVYNGLLAVNEPVAAIHDGVRPFIHPRQITATINQAAETGACILGIKAIDTLKQADEKNQVEQTLERKSIWLAQTPQTFQYDLILTAHQRAIKDKYTGTDDAALVERLGKKVTIIPGTVLNIKITSPQDLILAEAIHSAQSWQV
ncbi:2-C-methyl-D-erythritol 4-phosphate cytidylyltransferase [Desulfonema limicola]|uniref:2-C-methyl-D-erythritol 4-phosphate cytidylyltransferase n=1 Tax=Desulfonema limicola TaxID=45656 RepID=A0A975BB71_9BACT|nr:2-C-methyl-D-erythritol 4-phosphate cytidylyltransferase [Desulfonema limicola]QTA81995.1 2-C-methyl-D-erythritol 4-phosphate cytidylyltransferase [Desulfonema limicola]